MNKRKFNPYDEFGIQEKVRLVIYDTESKQFIKKMVISEYAFEEVSFSCKFDRNKLKYKYQTLSSEGIWENRYPYKFVFFKKNTKAEFTFENSNPDIFKGLKNLNDKQLAVYFRNILKKYYFFLFGSPNQDKIDRVDFYLKLLSNDLICKNNVVAHCYSQMVVLNSYISGILDKSISHRSFDESWYHKVINKYELNNENSLGFLTGSLVAKGHILSLSNRKKAFESYSQAIELGKKYIEPLLVVDPLTTYYPEVGCSNNSYEIISDPANFNSEYLNNPSINVCFSVDLSYFKIFSVHWASSSFYFKNIILNFGVVAKTQEDYEYCLSGYKDILNSIAKMMQVPTPNNFRFYWIKSSIINRTVYACARFYLAKHLLDNSDKNVYISDFDQLVVGDLKGYLQKIEDDEGPYSVYQPVARGFFSMLPGRSHLAGNIFIRNNNDGKKYCQMLVDYVGLGLNAQYSWILDQNATRYASENITVGNLGKFGKRPLKQYPQLKKTQFLIVS